MRYRHYMRSTVGRIFKLLPLREELENEAFLDVYLDDLANDTAGAMTTFPELYESSVFVETANSLNYMRHFWRDMPFASYRSSVLKMTNALSHMLEAEEEASAE